MPNERLTLQIDTVTTGTEQVNQLTNALNRVAATAEKANSTASRGPNPASYQQFGKVVEGAFDHAVPQVAAASAAIRTFEGALPIRAVERFLATTLNLGPALQAIFPIVGALAFAEVIGHTIEKVIELYKQWDPVSRAEQRAVDTAKALNSEVRNLGAELQKINFDAIGKAFGPGAQHYAEGTAISAGAVQRDERMVALLQAELARQESAVRAGTRQRFIGLNPDRTPKFENVLNSSAEAAKAEVGNLQKQLTAFQLSLEINRAKASESFRQGAQDRQDELEKKSDEASRLADQIEQSVDSIVKRGRDAQLTAIKRIYADFLDEFAKVALSPSQQKRAYAAVSQLSDAELQKQYNEAAKLPLRSSELVDAGVFSGPTKIQPISKAAEEEATELEKGLQRNAAFVLDGLKKANDALKRNDEAKFATLRASAGHQARLAELTAKPGDELAALRQGLEIRRQAAQIEFSIKESHASLYGLDVERFKLQREMQDAGYQYEEAVIEMRNKEIQSFRDNVVRGFDDIVSGRGGGALLKSFGVGIERQIVGNLAESVYPEIRKLTSGLHVGSAGGFLGNLLKGTPFGPDPLKGATDLNTTATIENTTAITALSRLAVSPSGGGGGIPSAVSGLGPIFSGSSSSNPFVFNNQPEDLNTIYDDSGNAVPGGVSSFPGVKGSSLGKLSSFGGNFSAGASSVFSGNALSMLLGENTTGPTTLSGRIGAGVGLAGTLAAGAYGISSGLSQGGVGGNLKAAGSAVGVAGELTSNVAKLLGAASPLLSAIPVVGSIAALALPLIGGLFSNRQRRENQINQELSANQYLAPTALNVTQDSSGHFTDFDARGNIRTSNLSPFPQTTNPFIWEQTHGWFGGPPTYYDVPGGQTSQYGAAQPTVVVNHNYAPGSISTMDAQSFHDFAQKNSAAVADATATGLQNAHQRLTSAIQYVTGN